MAWQEELAGQWELWGEAERAAYHRRLQTLWATLPGAVVHSGANVDVAWVLAHGGYGSVEALRAASDTDLLAVRGFGPVSLRALRAWLTPAPLPAWLAEE